MKIKITLVFFALFFLVIQAEAQQPHTFSLFVGAGDVCGGDLGVGCEIFLNENFSLVGAVGRTAPAINTYHIGLRYYKKNYFLAAGYGIVATETGGYLGDDTIPLYGLLAGGGGRFFLTSDMYIGFELGGAYILTEPQGGMGDWDIGFAYGVFLGFGF